MSVKHLRIYFFVLGCFAFFAHSPKPAAAQAVFQPSISPPYIETFPAVIANDNGATALAIPLNAPRYLDIADPQDIFRRLQLASRREEIDRIARDHPIVTLAPGGSYPDFLSPGPRQATLQQGGYIEEHNSYYFHVLDQQEYSLSSTEANERFRTPLLLSACLNYSAAIQTQEDLIEFIEWSDQTVRELIRLKNNRKQAITYRNKSISNGDANYGKSEDYEESAEKNIQAISTQFRKLEFLWYNKVRRTTAPDADKKKKNAEVHKTLNSLTMILSIKNFYGRDFPDLLKNPLPEHMADIFLPEAVERKKGVCNTKEMPRAGGNKRHNQYAEFVTKSRFDFHVTTPEGILCQFDGKDSITGHLWEVKTGYDNLSEAQLSVSFLFERAVTQNSIFSIESQRARCLYVAARCGYIYRYAFDNKATASSVQKIWDNIPPVEHIPYPPN